MSTTPSPSKRPRLPTTSSAVASATASPFAGTARLSNGGPRSVGPSGTSAIVGLGMSPMDTYSPVPGTVDAYGMSGFTPYSTTSPAYGGSAMASAASPISTALAHGSRVLSGIQAASPFYSGVMQTMPQQMYPGRYLPGMQPNLPMQQQAASQATASKPAATKPQPGSPEYLRAALSHLQTTLLAKLESEAEAFFDAADSAVAVTADSRTVAGKAKAFEAAIENVLVYLDKNGLASLPLVSMPRPQSGEQDMAAKQVTAQTTAKQPTEESQDPQPAADPNQAEGQQGSAAAAAAEANDASTLSQSTPLTLQSDIDRLQHQAKQLFDQRQRLKESASIVTAILDS